jgi:hypothetical protein
MVFDLPPKPAFKGGVLTQNPRRQLAPPLGASAKRVPLAHGNVTVFDCGHVAFGIIAF